VPWCGYYRCSEEFVKRNKEQQTFSGTLLLFFDRIYRINRMKKQS